MSSYPSQCSICFKSGPNFVLSCTHSFHAPCLYGCLQQKTEFPCPLCRAELSQDEQNRLTAAVMDDLSTGGKLPIEEGYSQESAEGEGCIAEGAAGGAAGVSIDLTQDDGGAGVAAAGACIVIDLSMDDD